MRADQIEIAPVDWLIEGWLAKDSLAGLVGPSGSCKSFLAVDWACRVATGTPWNGAAVERGAVFVLAGEGRNGLRKRIEGWSQHTGVSINGAPLYLSTSLPPMTDQLNALQVIAEIDALAEEAFFGAGGSEPALIVIDTVARAMAGKNENSAQDMGELVQVMDWLKERWKATVLAVHHTGHEASGRARGSSSFYAALDSEVVLKPGKPDGLTLTATKCKDWQPPLPLALKPQPVEFALPSLGTSTSTLVLVNTGPAIDNRFEQVQALRSQGLTVRMIADETGIPKSTVNRLLKASKPVWEQEFGDEPC